MEQAIIIYNGVENTLIKAVKKANEILENPSFISLIEAIPNFDNTSYSGKQIVSDMKAVKNVQVTEYYKWLTRANARTGTIVQMNTAKLGRPFESIVNTIIHEYVHSVDLQANGAWDYTHRSQKEEDPPVSAPWVIGALAEGFAK